MQTMRVLVRKPLALVVFLALLGVSAHAASIVWFTSQGEFQGRRGLPQLAYNFNHLDNGSPDTGQLGLDGLTIASGDMRVLDGALNFGPYPLAAAAPRSLAFNFFGQEVSSFGAQISPALGAGALNISVNDLTASIAVDGPGFIGFRTDFPFRAFNATFVPTRLDTNASAMHFVIDNVIAYTVPEPATLILLATGAGLAGLYARRRRALGGRRDEPRHAGDADPM